jgi:hypothetical protein
MWIRRGTVLLAIGTGKWGKAREKDMSCFVDWIMGVIQLTIFT